MPAEEEGLVAIHLEPTDKVQDNSKVASSLLLMELDKGQEKVIPRVTDFEVADAGRVVAGEQAKDPKDSLAVNQVFLFNGDQSIFKTIAKGGMIFVLLFFRRMDSN